MMSFFAGVCFGFQRDRKAIHQITRSSIDGLLVSCGFVDRFSVDNETKIHKGVLVQRKIVCSAPFCKSWRLPTPALERFFRQVIDMLRKIILKRLDSEERSLGASLDYLREIVRASLSAFIKFALFMPLAQHRRKLPAAAYRTARIVATRDEDCGTCVQIEVNLARKDGVPVGIIRSVLDSRPQDLPQELADVYNFATAIVELTGEEEPLRVRLRERYGHDGLVELSLGIATARVFPVTKRALGYATSCSLVAVRL